MQSLNLQVCHGNCLIIMEVNVGLWTELAAFYTTNGNKTVVQTTFSFHWLDIKSNFHYGL